MPLIPTPNIQIGFKFTNSDGRIFGVGIGPGVIGSLEDGATTSTPQACVQLVEWSGSPGVWALDDQTDGAEVFIGVGAATLAGTTAVAWIASPGGLVAVMNYFFKTYVYPQALVAGPVTPTSPPVTQTPDQAAQAEILAAMATIQVALGAPPVFLAPVATSAPVPAASNGASP